MSFRQRRTGSKLLVISNEDIEKFLRRGGFYTRPNNGQAQGLAPTGLEKIEEERVSPKIISISKQGEVRIFDPETGNSFLLPIKANYGSGALNIGGTDPLLSPNSQKAAYIDRNDKNVWIIDIDDKSKVKISNEAFAETEDFWGTGLYLSGWSSDEEWLVYYVEIVDEVMGMEPEEKLRPSSVKEGFYAVNLKTGKTRWLAVLPNFVDFLPSSDLIVFLREAGKKTDLYTFNLKTEEVEKLTQASIKGTFVDQFSFSSDQKHFSYTTSESKPSSARLVYASLDNLDREDLVIGGFADIQFPKISPDGRLIAYEKRVDAVCPGGGGCPKHNLILYDLEAGQERNLASIKKILYWLDDNRLVVLGGEYIGPSILQIVDRTTGLVKTLTTEEQLRSR